MQVKVEYLGNRELLEAHKTAFLCSRRVSSPAVLGDRGVSIRRCGCKRLPVANRARRAPFSPARAEASHRGYCSANVYRPCLRTAIRDGRGATAYSQHRTESDAGEPNCRRRAKPIYRRARRRDSLRIYRPR